MLIFASEIIFRADFLCVDTFLGTESESAKIFQNPPMRADLRIGRINVNTCLWNYISSWFFVFKSIPRCINWTETGFEPEKPNPHYITRLNKTNFLTLNFPRRLSNYFKLCVAYVTRLNKTNFLTYNFPRRLTNHFKLCVAYVTRQIFKL